MGGGADETPGHEGSFFVLIKNEKIPASWSIGWSICDKKNPYQTAGVGKQCSRDKLQYKFTALGWFRQ
jgi:hypothetical protein